MLYLSTIMFSYLDAVKKIVDESIYGRGVKSYLEGHILGFKDLILDYWRLYEVKGQDVYQIKIPLLHLALSRSKFESASQALSQNVICTCPYFAEFGICKHIVAVCASLEKEFNASKGSSPVEKQEIDSVLDQMFAAETKKQEQRWLERFQKFLKRDVENYTTEWYKRVDFWVQVSLEISQQPNYYQNFTHSLQILADEQMRHWEGEKRLTNIFGESVNFGGGYWLNLWYPYFDKLVIENQIRVWIEIWAGFFQKYSGVVSISKEFLSLLKVLPEEVKVGVFAKLQSDYMETKGMWLNFALQSEYLSWLQANLANLDPLTLLQTSRLLPDEQQEIEQRILAQTQTWSDFLLSGEYEQLTEVFQEWLKILGRTELYEQALDYIKKNHPKKKKLIQAISHTKNKF